MLDVRDLYWIAGFLEGEGWFGLKRGGRDVTIEAWSVDKDVIDRLHGLLRFGHRQERRLPSGKVAYGWRALSQADVAGLMMTLLPLMSVRRAATIRECLAQWRAKPLPKRMWTHCKNGHALSPDNMRVISEGKYRKRRCIECGKLRQRKYRTLRIAA